MNARTSANTRRDGKASVCPLDVWWRSSWFVQNQASNIPAHVCAKLLKCLNMRRWWNEKHYFFCTESSSLCSEEEPQGSDKGMYPHLTPTGCPCTFVNPVQPPAVFTGSPMALHGFILTLRSRQVLASIMQQIFSILRFLSGRQNADLSFLWICSFFPV